VHDASHVNKWQREAPTFRRYRWLMALLYIAYAALVVWQSLAARAWERAQQSDAVIAQAPPWAFWVMTGLACTFPLAFVAPAKWRGAAMAVLCAAFLACVFFS
jgi:hypothetical protein